MNHYHKKTIILMVLVFGIFLFAQTVQANGTISVSTNISVCWYVTGPVEGGECSTGGTYGGLPDGWYSISAPTPSGYHIVSCCGSPIPDYLGDGGSINWSATYEQDVPPPPPPPSPPPDEPPPPPPPSSYTLTVTVNGIGQITSNGYGTCTSNSTCSTIIPSGASVSLTGDSINNSTFIGWGGDCAGAGNPCSGSMTQNYNISANFSGGNNYTLTITVNGIGQITSNGYGTCTSNSTCLVSVPNGAAISLTAGGVSGSTFTGWGGDCAGAPNPCSGSMTQNYNVSANFNSMGTINIISNNQGAAHYTTYPDGSSNGWNGDHTWSLLQPGSYSLVADNVSGYTKSVSPSSPQTLSSGGTINWSITYTAIPAPSASITCNGSSSTTIPYNSSANVSWSSSNAGSCTVSPTGWSGTSGTQPTGNLTSSRVYTVTCNP